MTTAELEKIFTKYLYNKGHSPIAVRFRRVFDEMDILSVTTHNYLYEYELKISRNDFHNDAKKTKKHDKLKDTGRIDKPNYFYYVVPEGLVSLKEIPEYAGLITVSDDIVIVKEAPSLHKRKVSFKIMKSIAKSLTDKVLSDGLFWQNRRQQIANQTLRGKQNTIEWICNDCANIYNFAHRDELETFHDGSCDICKRDKIVAPNRYYYYPKVAI